EAWIVLDVGRDRELPAQLRALDHDGLEVRARGVEGGRPAGWTRPDDRDAVMQSGRRHRSLLAAPGYATRASKDIRRPGRRRCGVILRDVASGDLSPMWQVET